MGQIVFRRLRAGLAALLWTMALVGGLYALDRSLWGERPIAGWQLVSSLDDAAKHVGPIHAPALLPQRFAWPPKQIWVNAETQGWWLEVAARDGVPVLLISGQLASPPAMKAMTGCLRGDCPPEWRSRSRLGQNGKRVFVLVRGTELELERILRGLGH
jgi:hypothetical protein